MDGVIQALAALLAAVAAASGAPVDLGNSPDRPAIVAPVPAPDPSVKPGSGTIADINGTIQSVQGNVIVVNGVRVTLEKNTQVDGSLAQGAPVQVSGVRQTDGSVIARQVHVGSGDKDKESGGSSVGSGNDKDKATTAVGNDKAKETAGSDKEKEKSGDTIDKDKEGGTGDSKEKEKDGSTGDSKEKEKDGSAGDSKEKEKDGDDSGSTSGDKEKDDEEDSGEHD